MQKRLTRIPDFFYSVNKKIIIIIVILITIYLCLMALRPLPQEMMEYAQADTHYLLYVYDRLRADLFDGANGQPTLVQLVWSKSKDLCLKVQLDIYYE